MNQSLTDIVTRDHEAGALLYEFGIRFYEMPEQTLMDCCIQHSLDPQVISKKLYGSRRPSHFNLQKLYSLPLDLLVEYLKSAHQGYIRRKLPYFSDLVARIDTSQFPDPLLAADLKFIFPLFVEDFIHHIYEEEDEVFHYILSLHSLVQGNGNATRAAQLMERFSIREFAMGHDMSDDEMAGIRAISKDYLCEECTPLSVKVLYAELRKFETDLHRHAAIENEVLFPRALSLESKARHVLRKVIAHN